MDSHRAVLAKNFAHYYDDCSDDDGEDILGGIKDKDANCDNHEPVEVVVDTSAEEDGKIDLQSQDNKDIVDLCLLWIGIASYCNTIKNCHIKSSQAVAGPTALAPTALLRVSTKCICAQQILEHCPPHPYMLYCIACMN